jgi:hypothetical protein
MAAWALTPGNVLPDGLKMWQVRLTNAANMAAQDVAYYTLPYPFEGKNLTKSVSQADSRGVGFPYTVDLAYSAKFMPSANETNLIKLLPTLVRNPSDHILTFLNGQTACSNLTQKYFGLNFRLVSDSDMAKLRYIEFIVARSIAQNATADWTALWGTPPANGVANASDLLYLWATPAARTTITPGGVNSVTCSAVGGGGATDNLGKIRNFKLTIAGEGEKDNLGRTSPVNRAKFDVEVEMMQSAAAEITNLQVVAGRENDWVITFVDGMVLTLANPTNIGVDFEIHNDSDSQHNQHINIKGSGVITLLGTTFAGLWS